MDDSLVTQTRAMPSCKASSCQTITEVLTMHIEGIFILGLQHRQPDQSDQQNHALCQMMLKCSFYV